MTENDPQGRGWLFELLRRIERRPGLYLGAEDVHTLRAFTAGYYLALVDAGRDRSDDILVEFSRWLAATEEGRQVGATPNTPWWDVVPRLDPTPTNVQTFYRLFRRFLTETGRPPL